jgi:hypothetical protein
VNANQPIPGFAPKFDAAMATMAKHDRGADVLNDWRPETRALLRALVAAGFVIDAVSDGEEWTQGAPAVAIPAAVAVLTSVDEAALTVRCPDGKLRQLWLVYGNSPGELVSAYHVGCELLDKTIEAHADRWENCKQPTATARELYPQIYLKR